VVADKKTPEDWHMDGVEFLSVDEQLGLRYEIKNHIAYNSYTCVLTPGWFLSSDAGCLKVSHKAVQVDIRPC